MPKIVVFTPAGRQRYMQLLAPHILNDPGVTEWYVLDACRDPQDRQWLHEHIATQPKVRLFSKPGMSERDAIHAFYHDLTEPDTFYIKTDDDLVWMEPHFFSRFAELAAAQGGGYTWFSPMIVNNAICNWMVKHFGGINYPIQLFCMASCPASWLAPSVVEYIHNLFIQAVQQQRIDLYRTPNKPIMLSRFSINCIGFWGRERLAFGEKFAPMDVDDEEWVSAVWPASTGRPGLILGNLLAAHFSFYTQEHHLLQTNTLERYYELAGMTLAPELLEKARQMPKRDHNFSDAKIA